MQIFAKRWLTLFSVIVFTVNYSVASRSEFLQKEADEVLKKIDKSIPICDNFYEFACGNYKPEIPRHKGKIDELDLIKDTLQEQLNEVFKAAASDDDSDPIMNVKTYYANCMNTETIELLGLRPVKEVLSELGHWPVITNNWNESSWRWQDTAKKLELMGFFSNYLFDNSVEPDFKNSTRRIFGFDSPSFGLSKEYFDKGLDHELVKAYHNYQVDLAVIFGAERTIAEKEMKDVLLFEKSLSDIALGKEDRRNSSRLYNPIKLSEFNKIFSNLNAVEYLNTFLSSSDRVDDDEIVVISNRTYFEKLHKLLEMTPARTIANYMMWRASLSVVMFLNKEVRNRTLEYSRVLTGILEFPPRWKECVGHVSGSLSIAASSLYVKNYFDDKSRSIADEMVQAIRTEFEGVLNTVDWMDNETRKFALTKVKKMEKHIGYPNELVNDEILKNYYSNLTIEKDEYLKSYLNINRFQVAHVLRKFRKPVNKTEWEQHSNVAIANAYYFWSQNSITIPAGILMGRFFSSNRPNYMNYGAIGYVIGHEITHGFDDQGRQFDSEGNLVDWWQEDTKRAYLDKTRCIIEQYGNYTEPTTKLKLNGINTQGENIADNGGIVMAYRAYRKWSEINGPEESLPGLNFTSNQLFWLSVAQSWCSAYRAEEIKHRITTGLHSIARFRVIGPLSNNKDFSEDFKCPLGSPMNPEKKCKVW